MGRDSEADQWFKKAHALNNTEPAVWTHYGESQVYGLDVAEVELKFR